MVHSSYYFYLIESKLDILVYRAVYDIVSY